MSCVPVQGQQLRIPRYRRRSALSHYRTGACGTRCLQHTVLAIGPRAKASALTRRSTYRTSALTVAESNQEGTSPLRGPIVTSEIISEMRIREGSSGAGSREWVDRILSVNVIGSRVYCWINRSLVVMVNSFVLSESDSRHAHF